MSLATGVRLGPYEIVELLGAGGMGEVYRARDPRLGRDVAIKVLPAEVASDPDRLRRFEQEARAVAALNHPHILTVHDVGTHEGTPYVVTELLEGENLRELASRRFPTVKQVLGYALQAARGLEAAHARDIVHRDLKPENLFLTTDGRVKILDFGLAKLVRREELRTEAPTPSRSTAAGLVVGTVAYMSPEQARGHPVDPRSDVFSFGVVLYELLAGRHPFRRDTAAATLTAIVEETPTALESLSLGIPPAVGGIVRRCLEKTKEDRYASGHEVAMVLEAVLAAPSEAVSLLEVEERSPYPGLSSFTEKDAAVFFGREDEVKALWDRLRTRRLWGVIGPSGAGKTSFVRAGVLPARSGGWAAIVCTPGASPFRSLGQALVPELAGDVEALQRMLAVDDPAVAFDLVSRWRKGHGEALLVVDQFEELFTLNPEEVQGSLAALLGRLAREADVHVLLSLRDDFLMRCADHAPLVKLFESLSPLPALSAEGLRRALVEPARARGYRFEDDSLVGEMVDAVEGARGALPLLAFAVSRLWEKRDRERKLLTRAAYEEIGGVAGALAQHAEATMDQVGPERQNLVREIFRNLVTAQGTRAVIDREELLSAFPDRKAAEEVLRQLIDARLLTTYETEGKEGEPGHHRVEVVHESLLKAWPRLVRWQAQDEEGAVLRDQLKQAAHLWHEKGRTSDILWTGTAYQEYELWRGRYQGALTALEEDFARAMAEKVRLKRRIIRAAAAAVVLASTGVAIAIAVSRHQAVLARQRAEANALLALGRAELDRYPTAALAYGRKSLEVADTAEGRRFAVDALWRSPTARILPLGSEVLWQADFSPDGHWLAGYAFQGHLVLVPDDGGPVRVLPGLSPTGAGPPITRFAPGGEAVLTWADEEKSVRLWSVPDGREIRRFEPQPPLGSAASLPASVAAASRRWRMLPQGNLFFWWWPEGPLRMSARVPFGIWPFDGGPPTLVGSWPAGTYPAADPGGTRILALRGRRLVLRPLASSGDAVERPVAMVDDAGPTWWWYGFGGRGDHVWFVQRKDGMRRLLVWPVEAGGSSEPRVFSIPNPDTVYLPSWESDGSRLAWGSSADRAVWVWDLAGPPDAAPIVLRRPDMSNTKKVAFAPAHDWLVVAHHATLTFWSLNQPQARLLTGHRQSVGQLVFTRDSQSLVSCGMDDVRLWPLGPGRGGARRIATHHQGWCTDAAVSPDGEQLLLVGSDGAWLASSFDAPGRWLWDGRGEAPYEAPYMVAAAAWDASGRRVAVASGYAVSVPNAVGLFDLATGREHRSSLVPPGESGQGYDWGVDRLAFTPEGRLLAGGSGGVRWLDPETGASDWIWRLPKETRAWIAVSGDGRRLVAAATQSDRGKAAQVHGAVLVDLATGVVKPLHSHGRTVTAAVALDGAGRTLVTGDEEGVVRVGAWEGGEPHRLCCHAGSVLTVSVSPDRKWIASASGSEIRLWPMPDLSKPPLHTLPYDELMAKLRAMTNLQVVEDSSSPSGYKLDVGPFPGWKDAPER